MLPSDLPSMVSSKVSMATTVSPLVTTGVSGGESAHAPQLAEPRDTQLLGPPSVTSQVQGPRGCVPGAAAMSQRRRPWPNSLGTPPAGGPPPGPRRQPIASAAATSAPQARRAARRGEGGDVEGLMRRSLTQAPRDL